MSLVLDGDQVHKQGLGCGVPVRGTQSSAGERTQTLGQDTREHFLETTWYIVCLQLMLSRWSVGS